ncbi:MAG TPA: hypothetical protein VKO18_04980 [Terriglobia bacterium]|nr:hypothetical protein [Terriglobia bacterium]
MNRKQFWCVLGVLAVLSVVASSFAAGAAIGISWGKSEVIPVVLVKPGIGGFQPTDGSPIGNTWSRQEVKPVLLVKPGIAGFEPAQGFSIGNTWSRGDVIPVALTEPSATGFVPLQLAEATSGSNENATASPSVIESRIDGEFEGWEGETIIRLTNGQIWRQTEYHYEYHYAFMPSILIFKSGAGYKAKVEGTDDAVGVTRLK